MSALVRGTTLPIVGAPMAGGPSTVELAVAVSGAGGLGVLAGANLACDVLADRIERTRSALAGAPFGVNLFLPTAESDPPPDLRPHLEALDRWAQRFGVARGEALWDDDHWRAKVELVLAHPVSVVTFHFGCPPPDVVDALHSVGCRVWTTVTSRAEAALASAAGLDALVVQGPEAGGHRGTFANSTAADGDDDPGLLALLRLVQSVTDLPLVAAGGLVHGADVAAVLVAGAQAAQLGSAFLLSPEAGTSTPHRVAAAADRSTAVTRAFSGRPARGVRNELLNELSATAPAAYPHLNRAAQPVRAASAAADDEAAVALWAGQTHHLAHALPASEIIALVMAQARHALSRASDTLHPSSSPGRPARGE